MISQSLHKTNCIDTGTSIQSSNVKSLLQLLFVEGRHSGFYNATVCNPLDTAYGRFLCRGVVSGDACQSCINDARAEIHRECPGRTLSPSANSSNGVIGVTHK
ncbi:hypothetical protein MLD38_037639 [Melastoma candidum]|uniref:Uncharacterized protein n=1 Tax=Melastoma candidum TaxID=119954 RepID=A0ACB9LNG5_9MYRT|nr:hypothetical protein MLD38_037639 [Melastoma candidum]